MDRFIGSRVNPLTGLISSLKSNMDRFIARERDYTPQPRARLKSNMDRFIDLESGGTGYATKV